MNSFIGNLTGDNMGGNTSFWFIPVDEVVDIPIQENGVIQEDIELDGISYFYRGESTMESLDVDDDPKLTDNGESFPVSIKGRLPKDYPINLANFREMMRKKFVVIVRDNNNLYKLYGKVGQGLNFRYKTLKKGTTASYNGYEFEFYRTYNEPGWFYSGSIVEDQSVLVPEGYDAPTLQIPFYQLTGLSPDKILYANSSGVVDQSDYFKFFATGHRLSLGTNVFNGSTASSLNMQYFRANASVMQGAITWNGYWNGSAFVRQEATLSSVRFAANIGDNANTGIFVSMKNVAGTDLTAFSSGFNTAADKAILNANHALAIGAGNSATFIPDGMLEVRGASGVNLLYLKTSALADAIKVNSTGNLLTRAILGHTTNTYDIGSTSVRYAGLYLGTTYDQLSSSGAVVQNNAYDTGSNTVNGTTIFTREIRARRNGAVSALYRESMTYIGNGTTRRGQYFASVSETSSYGGNQFSMVQNSANRKLNFFGYNVDSYAPDTSTPGTAYAARATNILNGNATHAIGLLSIDDDGVSRVYVNPDGRVYIGTASNSTIARLLVHAVTSNEVALIVRTSGSSEFVKMQESGGVRQIGWWGGTPAAQQTLAAYSADDESGAYTGIDNAQGGTPYAKLTDINALRTAYEVLRAAYEDLRTKLIATTYIA